MSQKLCEVCNIGSPKYKCPICLIKFCCVACFKTHKSSGNCIKPELSREQKPPEHQGKVYEYETEDTVAVEKLNLLGYDKHVRDDLENTHLRQLLDYINTSQNPDKAIEETMKEPIFVEFVTHCLQVVDENH